MQADSAQQQGLYRPEFDHDACGIGALADINGERHHQILDDALSILVNLEHRGGTGLEKNTGDGAGILFQVPHHFFRKEAQKCGQILPAEGDYGVAMLFFPQDDKGVEDARRVFEEGCAEAGVPLLFWREVPADPHDLGETARACMPTILQAFLGRPDDTPAGAAFERRRYVCRRPIEKKGSEFTMDVDTVIMSLGTSPNPLIRSTTPGLETNKHGCIVTEGDEGKTSREGVYAGGDAVTGAATVIKAMGAGKAAAKAIDEYIQNK